MLGKPENSVLFQCFVGREGRKVGSSGQMRHEKLRAAVAQRAFPSQSAQNAPWLDHFWKRRCPKFACRFGVMRISKSKAKNISCSDHLWKDRCQKSTRACGAKGFGPLLQDQID